MNLLDKIISMVPGRMPRAPKGYTWMVYQREESAYWRSSPYCVALVDAEGEEARRKDVELTSWKSVYEVEDLTWPRIRAAAAHILDNIAYEEQQKRDQAAREKQGSAWVRTYGTKKKGAVEWLSSMTSRPDS